MADMSMADWQFWFGKPEATAHDKNRDDLGVPGTPTNLLRSMRFRGDDTDMLRQQQEIERIGHCLAHAADHGWPEDS